MSNDRFSLTKSILLFGHLLRICLAASIPCILGRLISRRIRSGCSSCAFCTVSNPSAVCWTKYAPSHFLNSEHAKARQGSKSSATSTQNLGCSKCRPNKTRPDSFPTSSRSLLRNVPDSNRDDINHIGQDLSVCVSVPAASSSTALRRRLSRSVRRRRETIARSGIHFACWQRICERRRRATRKTTPAGKSLARKFGNKPGFDEESGTLSLAKLQCGLSSLVALRRDLHRRRTA